MKNKKAIRLLQHIDYYLQTHTNESCEDEHTALTLAIKALEERPQGEWYFSCEKGWECNQCHEVVKEMPTCMREATYNFCPNCGADMRGKEE